MSESGDHVGLPDAPEISLAPRLSRAAQAVPTEPAAALLTPWQVAFLPSVAVLGVTLPLGFLAWLHQCLYYLRPIELAPVYGTAWLFIAVLVLPLSALGALVLGLLQGAMRRFPQPIYRRTYVAVRSALMLVSAIFVVVALTNGVVVWLQTFELPLGLQALPLLTGIVVLGGLVVILSNRAQTSLIRLRPLSSVLAVAGLLPVLTVPFFNWPSTPPPARAGMAPTASAQQPNILLITIDALSAEHMSLYGGARPNTPNLEQFAARATTFDHAYANANFTTPGVASLLTGTRPWTHRALDLPIWATQPTSDASLVVLLRRSGYLMGYVSTNPQAGAAKQGLGQYFDFASRDRVRYVGLCSDRLSSLLKYACPAAQLPLLRAFASLLSVAVGSGSRDDEYDPRLAMRPAIDWLGTLDGSKPVFLWVHLLPPHSPYATPSPWLGRFDSSRDARTAADSQPEWGYLLGRLKPARVHTLEARYDEAIAYTDHYVGELLQGAQARLGPNTIVAITADHGESFGHGYGAHQGPALYQELIHIPLLIRVPGQEQGGRNPAPAEQIDLAPTLAKLAGIEAPDSWEGRPLLTGPAARNGTDVPSVVTYPDKPAFSMDFEENPRLAALKTGSIAVIDGHWKLVHYIGNLKYPLMPPLSDELYDLGSDPHEIANLAQQEPGVLAHLRSLIDAQLARHGTALP